MKRGLAFLLIAVLVSGCSGRLFTYGGDLSDALVRLGPAAFSIYIHPKDDTLLIQRRMSQNNARDGAEMNVIVAQTFLGPLGCSIGSAKEIAFASWEVDFSCPSSIDVRTLAREQRASLQAGQPIRP